MDGRGGLIRGASREERQILAAVAVCFFFSGATGLIYEVLWTRLLGLVFGHTVFAITTVLAAFMAGLGIGSYLFGRVADRHAHPLLLYGALEAGVGLYALLTPFLFAKAEIIYIFLSRSFRLSFFAFSLSQFLLLFLILLVPTTLMGATLPVLSRFFVRTIEALGGQVGRLYALNTFGAVLGAYLAGFHLLPTLGVSTTLLLAAVSNIGIGSLAVVFDRHLRRLADEAGITSPSAPVPRPEPEGVEAPPRDWRSALAVGLTLGGLGVSGAASMMYEIAWTRALSLVIGSSTYAFSTMLVTFLGGLALGSALFSRLAGRLRVTPVFFGGLQLAIGLSALAVTPFFDRMPELFLRVFQISQSPGFVEAIQFFISALIMLLPTLFMGATFPCAIQIASREMGRLGQDVGRIYFLNTGGAIAGTVLAGFLLIPVWGLQNTLKLTLSLNFCLALALLTTPRWTGWRRGVSVAVALFALPLLYHSPAWDEKTMTSGVAIYGRNYLSLLAKAGFRGAMAPTDHLLYYRDGVSATVSVHQRGEVRYLRVNGKTDAGNFKDMHTQLMLGHLPLLFRPDAQRVLVIGLGSGVTAGAVALHPVARLDTIEIEPAVVEAAAFFTKENRQALSNPRVHLAVADGRNFLLASAGGYDVIISEPSNPWMQGIGNLFSVEFYELAARRMTPRGIMCQWIHVYNMFPEDLKMVVKTFRAVFPHTTIWDSSSGDLLLIGSREPLRLDAGQLQATYDSVPGLREDMERLGIHSPLAVLADFMLGEEEAAGYSRSASLNTDDLPLLEFSAPDSLYADTLELNRRILRSFQPDRLLRVPLSHAGEHLASAEVRRNLGLAFWAKEMPDEALTQFEEALRLDPRDAVSYLYRGKIRLRSGAVLQAEADLKASLRLDPTLLEAHETLAQLYTAQGMWQPAEDHRRQALALRPKAPRQMSELADFLRERRRFDEAIALYRAALDLAPQDALILGGLGLAYQGAGRSPEALEAARRATSMDPDNAFFQYQLGLMSLEAKQFDEAVTALQGAIRLDPLRPEPYLALGRLYGLRGETRKAVATYRQAVRLDPSNPLPLRAIEELSARFEAAGS